MNIREFQEKDFEKVSQLLEDFQDYLIELEPQKRMRKLSNFGKISLGRILKVLPEQDGKFYIAEDNEQIVGFIHGIIKILPSENYISHHPSTTGWIIDLYIDSKYRSKGIGKKLTIQLEKYFKEKGCDTVRLALFSTNIKAYEFYQSLGFENRTIEMIKNI